MVQRYSPIFAAKVCCGGDDRTTLMMMMTAEKSPRESVKREKRNKWKGCGGSKMEFDKQTRLVLSQF